MDTLEQLEKFFEDSSYVETGYFTEPSFVTAIVGTTEDGRLIYNYDQMVKFLVDNEGMEELEAMEFIDYNTIRTIPYMGDKAPIIMYGINE